MLTRLGQFDHLLGGNLVFCLDGLHNYLYDLVPASTFSKYTYIYSRLLLIQNILTSTFKLNIQTIHSRLRFALTIFCTQSIGIKSSK